MKTTSKILVIGDTHFPFHSERAYQNLMATIKKERPTHVIQIGDILDQFVFSKYTRSLEITPETEMSRGLEMARKMWKDIKKIVPKAQCYQLLGNHDVRITKRIAERLPELASFVKVAEFYNFPGVTVAKSDRDFFEFDGVVYTHGFLSDSLAHAKYFNKPTVHGHRHRPAINFENKDLWAMDVGYMADGESLPLSYTNTKLSKWTASCGIVENGTSPRLILL